MSRVRTFFLQEAAECLSGIREAVEGPTMDADGLYRTVRRFRGSAQMAGFGGLAARAQALEERLRIGRAGAPGQAAEIESLRPEVRSVLESLERDMGAVREGRLEGDPRTEAGMEEQVEGAGGEAAVVAVDEIEYRGEAALERALLLRPSLENAIVSDEPAGPILEELFDLIRLGLK